MSRNRSLLALLVLLAGCSSGSSSGGGAFSTSVAVAPATSAAPVTTSVAAPLTSSTAQRLLGEPLSPIHATASEIRDALGRHVLLRGVNVSERSKSPPFAGWLKPEHVDAFVRLGFDHVRFLLTWEAIEPRDGVFDDAYLDQVARELRWFEERGIRVVLDLHQDQYARKFGGDGAPEWALLPDPYSWLPDIIGPFPQNYANPKVIANFDAFYANPVKRGRMAKAWAYAAQRLKDSPAVCGYDLWNEPFPGIRVPWTFEANELSVLEAELVAALRAVDKKRILFFEPQLLAANFATTGLKRPNDPNLVYAPHYYDPIVDIRAAQGLKPAYDGDPSRTRTAIANIVAHGRALGCPVWLGEYGIERERGGAREYVLDHARLLDEALLSSCYWEANPVHKDLFTMFDPAGGDYPIAADLARPHPRAVAGTLEKVRFDPTTRVLEVEWAETGVQAPTLLELPFKTYPAGPIDAIMPLDGAGAWRVEREAATGRLLVWADPAAKRHRLVVRPR